MWRRTPCTWRSHLAGARARRGRRRWQARAQVLQPARASCWQPPVRPSGLRVVAQHRRRQAPPACRPRWHAHLPMRHQPPRTGPGPGGLPHRRIPPRAPPAPPGRASPASPPPPTSSRLIPDSHLNYLSYSLNPRTDARHHTPITRLPNDAQSRRPNRPSGRAPGGDERPGPEGPHLAGAPRPTQPATLTGPGPDPCNPPRIVPATGGSRARRWWTSASSHPAPAPPGAPRAPTAPLTPTGPCGAPTSANWTRTWRLPHRRIPPRALAAPPGRAPPASPPTPPRPIPFLGNHLNHLSYSLHRRISGTVSAPIARLPADPQRRHRVAHPVIPASRARNPSNARTDCMAGPAPIASLRHPRPAPHRPNPPGSSRATSHHPLAPTLTPRVPALPSFRSPQPC